MAALVVNYKSKDGRFTTQFSGDGLNQIFESLSKFQEVFEKNNVCKACNSANVLFNTRKVQKSKFYEKKCADCGAALTYHSNEEGGGLYTTYKDKWEKWAPGKQDDDKGEEEEAPKRVTGSKK